MAVHRTCRTVQRKLVDLIEQELASWEEQSVREHLVDCPVCQAKLAGLKAMLQAAQEAPVTPPSPVFWSNYLVGVRRKIQRAGRPWPSRIVPAVGLAAGFVLVVVLFSRQMKISPTTQRDTRPSAERTALLAEQTDYLYLAQSPADSADVVQIVTDELLSEEPEAFGLPTVELTDAQWSELWREAGSALDDYLVEVSDLDALIDEMDDQDQSELLAYVQVLSDG